MNKSYDTIIVGAGVAGISAARQLHKAGKDFIVISKNIGGRIESSEDSTVNYGAYFVLNDYTHILPFVKKTIRLQPFHVELHGIFRRAYTLVSAWRYPLQLLRFARSLFSFKREFYEFREQCESSGQTQAFEQFPNLLTLFKKPATEFAKDRGFSSFAIRYLSEAVYMLTFLPLSKVSAFDFMRACMGITVPAYEFELDHKAFVKGIDKKIVIDSVTHITVGETHTITLGSGKSVSAQHIILAVPAHVGKQLLQLDNIRKPSTAYVFHVDGELKQRWRKGQFELFGTRSKTIFIRRQRNGSYIFYSRDANPNLETYFHNPKILFSKHWDPAFSMMGNTLIDQDHGHGIYLAGDYNIPGMEDCAISGVYAANQVIRNS